MKKQILISYYRSISRPGRGLGYNWNALADLGLDDPREVLALNQELIAAGFLRRVRHANSFGDTSLYLVA